MKRKDSRPVALRLFDASPSGEAWQEWSQRGWEDVALIMAEALK
jgi:hypothetical protein